MPDDAACEPCWQTTGMIVLKVSVPGLLASLVAVSACLIGGPANITAAPNAARTLSIYNIHNKETTTITYKRDGEFIAAGLMQLNRALRDWRTNDETQMDPKLFDIIWEIHEELGSKEPVHLISGYRSSKTNESLRENGGGQAKNSRHVMGKAADIHFPDVAVKRLRYSALIRERGGVGYYPTSALPFVHVDTDRVRHWPPMPRYELALLFPDGNSKHIPSDGRPISKDDVRVAQSKYKDLAIQVAEFFEVRGKPDPNRTVLASLQGPFPVATPAALTNKPIAPAASAQTVADLKTPPQATTAPKSETRKLASLEPAAAASLGSPAGIMQKEFEQASGRQPAPRITPKLVAKPVEIPVATASALAGGVTAAKSTVDAKPAANSQPKDPLGALMARELASMETASGQQGVAAPTRMAALDPKTIAPPAPPGTINGETLQSWGSGYAQAPEFDEEHPEELSYRPFSIGPILTAHAGHDHPVLAQMQRPDYGRVFELLDEPDRLFPLSFRPGKQVAEMMMAGQFNGDKVSSGTLMGRLRTDGDAPPAQVPQRQVQTSYQR